MSFELGTNCFFGERRDWIDKPTRKCQETSILLRNFTDILIPKVLWFWSPFVLCQWAILPMKSFRFSFSFHRPSNHQPISHQTWAKFSIFIVNCSSKKHEWTHKKKVRKEKKRFSSCWYSQLTAKISSHPIAMLKASWWLIPNLRRILGFKPTPERAAWKGEPGSF